MALGLGAWLAPAWAHADHSPSVHDRLLRGETVTFQQTLERGEHRYVGGIAYTVVDAPAPSVAFLLEHEDTWKRVLPRTRAARQVGSQGADTLLELTQGTALVQATYTVILRREGQGVRFWLDPRRPHDIDDAWGFLRAEALPDGRSLVTFGILIDMGNGLLRDLFEERVRALALSVPDRVRTFVDERNAAGKRASRE